VKQLFSFFWLHRYNLSLGTYTTLLAAIILSVIPRAYSDDTSSFNNDDYQPRNINTTGWVSVLNRDIGTIGTLADNNPVLQVYGATTFKSGFYTSLWANIPLDSDNKYRSTELDLAIGASKTYSGYTFDFSLAVFDIENPDFGDLNNDIVTTRFRVDKANNYFEMSFYEGMGARDGWLTAIGNSFSFNDSLSLSSSINYTSGPFTFKNVVFLKAMLHYTPRTHVISYFVEVTDQLYRQDPDDPRKFVFLSGLRYSY